MDKITPFINKMHRAELPKIVIELFKTYFDQLQSGHTGFIKEDDIAPLKNGEVERISDPEHWANVGSKFLQNVAIIKLNGGLGTTMGLDGPKSLITVKNSFSFLDITAQQIKELNAKFNIKIPLILMNSFKTVKPSLEVLSRYPEIATEIPFSFEQHKFPRISMDFHPITYQVNPTLEWAPPGHGDLYVALATSGMVDKLLDQGYKYLFVSNIDNLGAVLDTAILGYFAHNKFSFLMEVTQRTYMDRKGGHLARLKENGKLVLREAAQCHFDDKLHFMNTDKYRFFNTNNLWIDLQSLKNLLDKNKGHFQLPMIRNVKKVDARNSDSPEAFQLETAMGSAISTFDNAYALEVPRTRFAPVKQCEELLLLWSDYFIITPDFHITKNPLCTTSSISIDLDSQYYKNVDMIRNYFPYPLSLYRCESLQIKGEFRFGKNVSAIGKIRLENRGTSCVCIPDNTVLDSNLQF